MAYKEKRGKNSWRLVVDVGYKADGSRDRRTKTIKVEDKALLRTKKKLNDFLEAELHKFKMEVEAGAYIAPEKMTFGAFVEEWREKYASDPKNLSPTTLNAYENHLRNHILPVFQNDRIDQIKPLKIVSFLKDLEKPGARKDGSDKPLASGTIEVIYRTLRNIFNRAVDWKVIASSPMDGVKKPKVEYKQMEYYDEEEARQVVAALEKEPLMWRLFIFGAMFGGLRRGELLGLEWSDVDYENQTLNIEKNIPFARKGKAVVKDPKTKSSKAPVEMPGWYMDMLKAYEREWKKGFMRNKKYWQSDRKYIFHSGLGKPIYYSYPTEWWRKCCKRHGLKYITVQNLRHSCATLLLEENIPMKKIQERLRHSRYETTANIYTHVTKRGKTETASAFDKFHSK